MAVRAGIDLVDVEEVCAALRHRPARYLRRVYTEREVAECTGRHGPDPRRLAARFAAKEATVKALRGTVPWRAIEVRDDGRGPTIALAPEARALADRRGVEELSVSMGETGGAAFAIVLARVTI